MEDRVKNANMPFFTRLFVSERRDQQETAVNH